MPKKKPGGLPKDDVDLNEAPAIGPVRSTIIIPGEYDVIYADPPWRYDFSRSDSREIENHYPTMSMEDLAALKLPAAKDSVLFLWATAPKLSPILRLMEDDWGFGYRTGAVWDKKKIGMGYWFRGRHEHLLVGVRGKFSPPDASVRIASVIEAPRGEHSAKPTEVREWIAKAFSGARKIELFARERIAGWDAWGNEVPPESPSWDLPEWSETGHGANAVS